MSDYFDHVSDRYEKLCRHADTWTPRTPTRSAAQKGEVRRIAAAQVSRMGCSPDSPVTSQPASDR